jgi:hypothetical protein
MCSVMIVPIAALQTPSMLTGFITDG